MKNSLSMINALSSLAILGICTVGLNVSAQDIGTVADPLDVPAFVVVGDPILTIQAPIDDSMMTILAPVDDSMMTIMAPIDDSMMTIQAPVEDPILTIQPVGVGVEVRGGAGGSKRGRGKARGGQNSAGKQCMNTALAALGDAAVQFKADVKASMDQCKSTSADRAAAKACFDLVMADAKESEIGLKVEAAKQSCRSAAQAGAIK